MEKVATVIKKGLRLLLTTSCALPKVILHTWVAAFCYWPLICSTLEIMGIHFLHYYWSKRQTLFITFKLTWYPINFPLDNWKYSSHIMYIICSSKETFPQCLVPTNPVMCVWTGYTSLVILYVFCFMLLVITCLS